MVLLLLVGVCAVASAQDGLYAPVRPEDRALVRILHGNPDESAAPITIDIGTTRFSDVAPQSGTAYRAVRPGVYVVMAYGYREALTATNGAFYTVAITPDGISVIPDTYHDDPLRAQLVLYNMTSTLLRMDAVVPEAPLMNAVAPGSSSTVSVNAIAVTLAVSRATDTGATDDAPADSGATRVSELFTASLRLKRGASYGLVVSETDAGTAGFVVEASIASSAAE